VDQAAKGITGSWPAAEKSFAETCKKSGAHVSKRQDNLEETEMATATITDTTTNATSNIRTCARCSIKYDWRRSPSSSLKMTYCGSLCEAADLGFTIEAMLHASAPVKAAA
jgi:hypothetical protein